MATFISHSPAETEAFAARLVQGLQPGAILGLTGDLGSGKTQFVKGLARGLGISEPVLSPTFALLHTYTSGRLPLYHMDLYRLDGARQIFAAGLEEYFGTGGITVIEWWERWGKAPPPGVQCLRFTVASDTERCIEYDHPGP
jgi:tRNA threonylcarbamoyladenosine biosynthesis protein TsaE